MGDMATFPATSPQALATALRTLRKRRNLTQDELAQIVGIQRSYLSQLENGEVSEQLKRVFDLIIALSGELRLVDRAS